MRSRLFHNLVSILFSQLDYAFKIVITGPSQVGKTCFVHKYTEGYFLESTKPTIGVDFALKKVNVNLGDQQTSNCQINFQLWDFAGEAHYEHILPFYVHGTHILLLSFDSTEIKTLEVLTQWLLVMRKHISDVLIILVSMKNDLRRTVPDEAIEEFMKRENIDHLVHTSSKTGENVEIVFQKCTDYAREIIMSEERLILESGESVKPINIT